jgi:uncharacterized membrane protein
MPEFFKTGRYLFGLAIIGFGLTQFVAGHFMAGFFPVSETFSSRAFFLYFTSTLFVFAGLTIFFDKTAKHGAMVAVTVFLAGFVFIHLLRLIQDLHNAGYWTTFAEMLGYCGGGYILLSKLSGSTEKKPISGIVVSRKTIGFILFSISLILFGIQHFMYADYIATLIPVWIPFPVYWAYFVGITFFAGAISILTKIKTQLACLLLGFMFLFWVIFLHSFRVASNVQKETEWTSLFVALGFAGIFFMIAEMSDTMTSETTII